MCYALHEFGQIHQISNSVQILEEIKSTQTKVVYRTEFFVVCIHDVLHRTAIRQETF